MAPELFNITNGEFGLPTHESDVFALGMVTFEVRNTYHGRSLHGFETPSRNSTQVFTGQVPFQENKSLAFVMKRIINGEKPQRPRGGRKLGLSDELWEVIQSSLAHEVKKRPLASTFVDSLENATPDIAALKGLTGFDASSQGHIEKLRHMFELGDNTLLGMREEETLTVIEVFDQVSLPDFLHFLIFRLRLVPGSQLLIKRPDAPQPMFTRA